MSMFNNPGYLNMARQFMAGPSPRGGPNAGRFPNMQGFSRSPMGQGLMQKVLQQMRQRKAGIAGGRRQANVGFTSPYTPRRPSTPPAPYPTPYMPTEPYTSPTEQAPTGPRQVKRETTEYFDGQQPTPSNVGRRP